MSARATPDPDIRVMTRGEVLVQIRRLLRTLGTTLGEFRKWDAGRRQRTLAGATADSLLTMFDSVPARSS